ncbi:glycosyltransferase [uncultured Methanobrevibacter sp.]|uniref:glycosyltransferase family 2 protein n=1 Tax=uncultured Methanobrevibacter sp. TaxID=253161 RepID=UPI0025E17C77|nr:glycosyltransferase [uncultured Methanobrevibacter sp.]
MVKVSVIVPVYNVEKYLEECLESIIDQSLRDIEIVCVNDGSTDGSLSILEEYAKLDDRIKIISQENQGLAAARNTGLDNISGDYVYFIDSDDFLELNALEELYNVSVEKSLDFVLFKLINFDDETNEFYTISGYEMPAISDLVGDNVFNHNDLGELNFKMAVSATSKLYNREFINKIGARFPEGLIFEDNVFFWNVLFNAERIYFLQEHFYNRRRHANSITGSASLNFVDTLEIHNRIFEIFKKQGQFEKYKEPLFNQKVSSAHVRLARVNKEDKPLFFAQMKMDFEQMVEDYGYESILLLLNKNNKSVFQNVILSRGSEEYLLLMKKDRLENNIGKMSLKNKKLKKDIKSTKKKNNLMLNSRSWKITKPLRAIKNNSFKESLLNKSNSYVYYKSGYKKLSKENKNLLKKNKALLKDNDDLALSNKLLKKQNDELKKYYNDLIHKYDSLNNNLINLNSDYKESREFYETKIEFFNDKINIIREDFVHRDGFNKSLFKELQYAFVFDDTIKESEWLNNQNFSLINAAANYSFAYSLYRILNDAKPKNILELGLGQTTRLTTQYVNHFNDSKLTVVEGDKEWIDLFTESLDINDNTQILNLDLESFTYQDDETIRFKGFLEALGDQKFDLIIIDGPQGFIMDSENNVIELNYSRTNVWQLIPQNLADDFIIIMDDFNRVGEQNTFEHIRELLNENNIEFYEYNSWAFKTQHALFTENYKYIGWI